MPCSTKLEALVKYIIVYTILTLKGKEQDQIFSILTQNTDVILQRKMDPQCKHQRNRSSISAKVIIPSLYV